MMETMILFPVVIGVDDLSGFVTKEHRNAMSYMPYDKNEGNRKSKESFILHMPEFADLLLVIEDRMNNFFIKNYAPRNNLRIKVTQSWLNVTVQNEFHHKHKHANSAFSSVLYLSTTDDDVIEFYNPNETMMVFEKQNFNIINSPSWTVPVKSGQLFIFPSWLMHAVPKKQTVGQRVSMAINSFYEGNLGNVDDSTFLKITVGEKQ